ncbi:MAG: hypothetical protein R2724_22690 [Bryobacterales bacterium]
MDGAENQSARTPGDEHWALRLAGSQDDANPELWARNVRDEGFSLGRLMGALDRRRWLALTVFVALLAPAAAWVWTLTPRNRGTMLLL